MAKASKLKAPTLKYTPSWKKHEQDIFSGKENSDEKMDKFLAERDHAIKTDSKARKWEKGRKMQLAKNKPIWAKKQKELEEKPFKDFEKKLKTAGSYEYGLIPTPGYILVAPQKQEQTKGGIILPNSEGTNIGKVLEIGPRLYCKHCFVSASVQPTEPPAKKGDMILHKVGAGMDIQLKNKDYKIMMFSDVLGILK